MDDDKVQGIQEWRKLQSLCDVQSFLGFANFYRQFIFGFSRICHPLTDSTKGDKRNWIWTPAMERAFNDLKNLFISAPVLSHYNPTK
jgi:hypothetical protein